MRCPLPIILSILLALSLPGYIVSHVYAQSHQGARVVVATTHPALASLITLIGGEYVDVVNIIPPGVDPHEYEPPTDVIKRIGSSDIILIDALHHLPISDKIYDLYRDRSVVLLDELLKAGWRPEKIPGTDVENIHEVIFDKKALLLSIDMVSKILAEVARNKGLDISQYIIARGEMLKNLVSGSFDEARDMVKSLGISGIALYSPALYYLTRSLGINVSIILTTDPDVEPSPSSLQALKSLAPLCLLVASDLERVDVKVLNESLAPLGIKIIPIETVSLGEPGSPPFLPLLVSSKLVGCIKTEGSMASVGVERQLSDYLLQAGLIVLGLAIGIIFGFVFGRRYGARSH